MAFTHQALKQYEKSIDNHLFRKHRCYAACGEDYSCEAGDYYPIMNFIRDAGEQLLIQDLENFDVKVMELASDDVVADFYCEHPHELFRAAYIKVSEKDTIGKCYSRLYVFCSGHEETFSDGSSFPVCDSHYVMVVKEGKKYKVPYPFDCNRFADELNKKSNEKERLTPAQRPLSAFSSGPNTKIQSNNKRRNIMKSFNVIVTVSTTICVDANTP